jgi:hypothetical protein
VRFYRCANPTSRCSERATVSAEPAEALVIAAAYEKLGGRVERQAVDLTPIQAAVDEAQRQLDEVETEKASLAALVYALARAEAEARLAAAQDCLEMPGRSPSLAPSTSRSPASSRRCAT